MCQDGNMNLKKNDAFARGNNNANVFKVVGAKVVGLGVKSVQFQGEGVGCGRWQGRRCGGTSLEVRRRPKPRLPTSLQEDVVEVGREQGGRAEQGGGRRDHGGGRGEQAAE